jgi:hypothetical protein
MITIKLESPKNVLYARIRKKRKNEQGGEWLFSEDYQDKYEFVKKLFREFKMILEEIKIDTGKFGPEEVFKTAIEKLKGFIYS